MTKKDKLKSRLAAIGISFPDDKEKSFEDVHKEHKDKQASFNDVKKINERRKRLGNPKSDSFEEEQKRQTYIQYGDKIRPSKPKDSDFSNIISAAREKIREAKTDHDHNHGISWRQVPKGDNGYRSASLVIDTTQKKFTKYWLLNAKQINGNGWGVDPETIDENIKKFVGKPFVVTAKSWIPNSEYGDSFEHPYIPTNNLRKIFMHQAKFAVGTIRRIIKDKHDDYYAMIEKFPRYAHMRDPPFCSPGIFQMNRNEPMNKIRTWEPLHLAGLELDPAYGAQVALLKGSCVGTENECHIQFRGAKLEVVTECPIRNARKEKIKNRLTKLGRTKSEGLRSPYRDFFVNNTESENEALPIEGQADTSYSGKEFTKKEIGKRKISPRVLSSKYEKIKSRLADLNPNGELKHMKVKEVIDKIKNSKEPNVNDSTFITPEGEEIGAPISHYDTVREYGPLIGVNPHRNVNGGQPIVGDDDIHEFLKKTGLIRVQKFKHTQYGNQSNVHIATPLTSAQRSTIKQISESKEADGKFGYFIGPDYEKASNGEGFREMMKEHAKQFGQKTAQAEDVDSVFNMTYTKSKPTKVKKKILKAQIEDFQMLAGSDAVVKAFKNKQKAVSGNYSTNGQEFFLFKNKIAEHSPKGLRVSNAGYDTPTTYKAIKQLGVRAEVRGGQTYIHDKPYKHGTFVTVPYDEVSKTSLIESGGHNRGETNETLTKLRTFRNTVMRKHNNLSQTSIQPEDQRTINKITGVKTPIPKTTRATAVHHILYRRNVPGMQFNPNNGIPLDRKSHSEAHHFDRLKTSQVRTKIQNARLRSMFAAELPIVNPKYKINEPAKVKINPEHGRIIADAYDNMKHEPENPKVKASYNALISETKNQYNDLIKGGLKTSKIKGENPYKTSKEMHADIEQNNHLHYYPTEEGFGSGEDNKGHPMLQPTDVKDEEGKPMLANDIFRIVHDVNGHHLGGKTGFGPTGEHQAYLNHKKMYSPLAGKALFTETAGQNNWVNFSKSFGEKNRKDPKHTTYAAQKAGLMPDNIINGDFHNG